MLFRFRRAVIATLFVSAGLGAALAQAPLSRPPPGMQNVTALPVPYDQAMPQILGRSVTVTEPKRASSFAAAGMKAQVANSCGTTLPPEIVELSRALKGDPDLIYEYVYNNIDTIPMYGSLKGALGALVDRSGTAFDQAELMVALLQQAGSCATFETGQISLTAAQLTAWLNINTALANNQYGIGYIIGDGGFPGSVLVTGSQVSGARVGWAWVQAQIGGTSYVFDPATKAYNRPAGLGATLATALGYSQTSFLSTAQTGATIDPEDISGVNRAGIRSTLSTYANNLVSYLKTNDPSANPTTILGGRTIAPLTLHTHQRITSLPYQYGTVTPYSTLPDTLRTTLALTIPGATKVTLRTSDIYGHRLSLFFNSSIVPTLALDGVAQATGSAAANGAQVVLITAITHPYVHTFANYNNTGLRVTASANGAFVIENGWGQVSRGMIERHRNLLQQAIVANPGNPSAEAVLGESLTMLGYTWLAESARVQQLTDALAGTSTVYQHAVGIVGMKPVGGSVGPFVDLPLNILSIAQINGRSSSATIQPSESAAFFADAGMSSVLESGSIEQTQPGVPAASTVKLLDIWAQSGKIFDINNTAVSGDTLSYYTATIRPQLVTTYSTNDLCRIDYLVGYTPNCYGSSISNPTMRVIAPLSGSITVGLYTGTGYFQIAQDGTSFGAIITGGLSGGEPGGASTPGTMTANGPVVQTPPSQSTIPVTLGTGSSNSAISAGTTGDPINQITGAYQYSHDDLTVGSKPFPYGLGFQRSYDSSRTAIGPLGTGWTDNFAITENTNSDGFEGMASLVSSHG